MHSKIATALVASGWAARSRRRLLAVVLLAVGLGVPFAVGCYVLFTGRSRLALSLDSGFLATVVVVGIGIAVAVGVGVAVTTNHERTLIEPGRADRARSTKTPALRVVKAHSCTPLALEGIRCRARRDQ